MLRKNISIIFLLIYLSSPFITKSYCGWDIMPPIPHWVNGGGALSPHDFYDQRIYAICGGGTNKFYYFDLRTNTWHDLTHTVPEGVVFDDGSCMTFIPGEKGKLLIFATNQLTGNNEAYLFHKHFIWRERGQIGYFPNFWQIFPLPSDEIGAGAALTYHVRDWGPPIKTDVYAFIGNLEPNFYRTKFSFPSEIGYREGMDIYPPEDAIISENQLIIDWKNIEPCDGYHLQISQDSLFRNLLIDEIVSVGEFETPSLLDGKYFCRFRFIRSGNFSDWTSPIRFFINTSLPKPAGGAFLTTPYPNFDWEDDFLAEFYQFQLDDNPDFSSPIIDTILENSNFQLSNKLVDGIYYWRYKTNYGNWTDGLKLEIYTLSFGVNSFVANRIGATLDWVPIAGAIEYQIQVAKEPNYLSVILDETSLRSELSLSKALAKTLCVGKYWWRVRYRNNISPEWSKWIEQNPITIWESLSDYPHDVGAGGSLAYAFDTPHWWDCIYGLRGDDEPDSNFYKYNLSLSPHQWYICDNLYARIGGETIAPAYGASLAWAYRYESGKYIYATLGNETNKFFRYNIWADRWSDAPADLPEEVSVSDGGAITYVPDTFVFCLVGGNTNLFYRYTMSSLEEVSGEMSRGEIKAQGISLVINPNPIINKANITFSTKEECFISLKIYDAKGRLVKILTDGNKEAGSYNIGWNRDSDNGKRVSSGVYFLNLTVKDKLIGQKKLILR